MSILIGLGWLLGGLVAAAGLFYVGSGFLDGPVEFFSGGPLRSGEAVEGPISDWRFAREVPKIEVEFSDGRSRYTYFHVSDTGEAFLVAGFLQPGKRWPFVAERDGGSRCASSASATGRGSSAASMRASTTRSSS